MRVFAADGAAQQLAYLERNVGPCAQSPGVSRAGVDGLPGDDVLVAVLPESTDGDVTVVGAVRRGKVTAGVEVVVPLGAGGDVRRAAGRRGGPGPDAARDGVRAAGGVLGGSGRRPGLR